jgi:hypothetical protein
LAAEGNPVLLLLKIAPSGGVLNAIPRGYNLKNVRNELMKALLSILRGTYFPNIFPHEPKRILTFKYPEG